MLKRISNFFSYKSQYGENRLVFLAARLKNTAKRDGYERDVAKANVSDPGEKLTFRTFSGYRRTICSLSLPTGIRTAIRPFAT